MSVKISVSRSFAASLVIIGIALNVVMGFVASLLAIPGIYLDLSGTILTALVLGPWWGALTGMLTNITSCLIFGGIVGMPFALVNALCGIVVGVCRDYGLTKSWIKFIPTFLLTCLAVSASASIIVTFLFGGATGAPQDVLVFALLSATGWDVLTSVFVADIVGKPIDVFLEYLICFLVLRALPEEYRAVTPYARKAVAPVTKKN